jgi:hypothetical protein
MLFAVICSLLSSMAQSAQEQQLQQRRQPEQLEQCLTQRNEDELFGAWCNDNSCEQTVSSKDKVFAAWLAQKQARVSHTCLCSFAPTCETSARINKSIFGGAASAK